MTEKEEFDAALQWVEHDLANVVTVARIGPKEAEIIGVGVSTHSYSVCWNELEGWGLYKVRDGDVEPEYLDDNLLPHEAVGRAAAEAVQDAMGVSLGFDEEQ